MEKEKDNRGAIWPNKRRESDKHPHFTGSMTIDGKEYYVSAWKKGADAKENAPSLSFSVKLKEPPSNAGATNSGAAARPATADFPDDDIPF